MSRFGIVVVVALTVACCRNPPERRMRSVLIFDPTILPRSDSADAWRRIGVGVDSVFDGGGQGLVIGSCWEVFVIAPGRLGREPERQLCMSPEYRVVDGFDRFRDTLKVFRASAEGFLQSEWRGAHTDSARITLGSCILTGLSRATREGQDTTTLTRLYVLSDFVEACDEAGWRVNLEVDVTQELPIDSVRVDLRRVTMRVANVPHDSVRSSTERSLLQEKWAEALARYQLPVIPALFTDAGRPLPRRSTLARDTADPDAINPLEPPGGA